MFYFLAQDCVDSGEGAALHAGNGEVQAGQEPAVTNVPWSNFNGEHGAEYWELEELGLTAYICEHYDLPSCA